MSSTASGGDLASAGRDGLGDGGRRLLGGDGAEGDQLGAAQEGRARVLQQRDDARGQSGGEEGDVVVVAHQVLHGRRHRAQVLGVGGLDLVDADDDAGAVGAQPFGQGAQHGDQRGGRAVLRLGGLRAHRAEAGDRGAGDAARRALLVEGGQGPGDLRGRQVGEHVRARIGAQHDPALRAGGLLELVEQHGLAGAARSGDQHRAQRAAGALQQGQREPGEQVGPSGQHQRGDPEGGAERVGLRGGHAAQSSFVVGCRHLSSSAVVPGHAAGAAHGRGAGGSGGPRPSG